MNERDLKSWLDWRAPTTAPETLRARVASVTTDTPTDDRSVSRRRVVVVGLIAAALVGSMVTAGAVLDRREPRPVADRPGNGLIVVADGERTTIVVPTTGAIVPLSAVPIKDRLVDVSAINGADSVAWASDGRSLAFTTETRLDVIDVVTGDVHPDAVLDKCDAWWPCAVTWSPDGNRMAVTNGTEITISDVNGTGLHERILTVAASPNPQMLSRPAWSPDGGSIAFADPGMIQVINADGTGLRTVVTVPDGVAPPFDLHWSPDGSRIGYMTSDVYGEGGWRLQLVTVKPDGSDPTVVVDVGVCYCNVWRPGFTWSPDGTKIAFTSPGFQLDGSLGGDPGPPGSGLYVANADGSDARLIRQGLGGSPAWQPVP